MPFFLKNSRQAATMILSLAALLVIGFTYWLGDLALRQDENRLAKERLDNYRQRAPANPADNLTSKLGESVLNELKINIPQDHTSSSSLSIAPTGDIINDITFTLINDLDLTSFKPTITDSNIIIINNNSTSAWTDYFTRFADIVASASPSISDTDSVTTTFIKQINAYDSVVSNLYSLPVPSELSDFHKQEISLLLAKKNITEAILTSDSDPLRALVAMQINTSVDEDLALLKKSINNFIQEHNL